MQPSTYPAISLLLGNMSFGSICFSVRPTLDIGADEE